MWIAPICDDGNALNHPGRELVVCGFLVTSNLKVRKSYNSGSPSFFTRWKIRSNGFLYVGSTLAASILQFESTIRSHFAFSAGGCLR
jgi:hypothetical protein